MANINVNRSVEDAFYRYKMPRIIAKVEGKGNGIKTVIVNMAEVAKSLSRPPTYPTKYFGCELGAQTNFDLRNDRFIVNGCHDSAKLQDLLDGFIKRFILCQECDNPETILTVQPKKGMILMRCIACGHTGNVDMRHKLTTFILKNPPDVDPSSATPSKKDKREKRKEKKGTKSECNGDTEENDNKTDNSSKRRSLEDTADDEDDVDWGEDTSEAAVNKRMGELTTAAKNMTFTDDLEKTPQERIDIFYAFVKDRKERDELTGAANEKAIVGEAERLDIKEKAPIVLTELLFDTTIMTQMKRYRTLLLRFTQEDSKAQKYLLGGFEQLVGLVYKDDLMPRVPHILKGFYELDILDEETLIEWDKKASKKYVSKEVSKEIHNKAAPFIKWLVEAEEESSDEDSEEEEVEVVYSHTEKVGTQTIPKEKEQSEEDEDDDLDIDDI